MSATEALLDAIVSRLQAAFTAPKLECKKWPNDPKAKPQFTGAHAAMWVGYDGSRSSAPDTIDHPIQMRERRVMVALFARALHGVHGAADYVDAVHEVLHGYRPSDGGRLTLAEDRFGAEGDGIWRYDLIYSSSCLAIPIIDSTEPGPALRRVTLDDTVGGSSEVAYAEPEEP